MKKLMMVCAAAIAAVAMAFAAEAKTWYVTPEGGGDGSAWESPMTLDEASSAAQSGDEVWVKAGEDYALTAPLFTTQAVTVRGGFAGTETTAEERTGSDVSVFDGTAVDNCIANTAATGTLVLDRLELKNSIYRGLYKTGDANLQMVGCRIVSNGKVPGVTVNKTAYHGRGIYVTGTAAKSSAVTITGCRFEDNVRPLNNAFDWQNTAVYGTGAYFSNLSGVTISGTDFIGNGLFHDNTGTWYYGTRAPSRDYARGSAFYSNNVKMTVDGCRFIGNRETTHGATDGGCVVVYGGAGSSFSHCLWAGNDGLYWGSASCGRNAAVVFQAASASDAYSMNHCTVAYNIGCWSTVAGVACYGGNLSIANSIVYGNVADKDKCIAADLYAGASGGFNASVSVDYSLVTSKADPYSVAAANCTIDFTEHVQEGDPLFATDFQTAGSYLHNRMTTPSARLGDNYDMYAKLPAELETLLDLHLKSPKGRWNGTAWVKDSGVRSQAIDAGDPTADYSLEPEPNGKCVNLGCYGATAEASKGRSLMGLFIFVQ